MNSKITGILYWLMGTSLIALTLFPSSAVSGHNCSEDECIPLHECPFYVQMLRKPTTARIRKVQAATCYIEFGVPMVCCRKKRMTFGSNLIPSRPGTCGQGTNNGLHRIFGGEEAPINAYPWIAALGYSEIGFPKIQYHCAGSIINDRYILTAAHCVSPSILNLKKLEVITLGDWDLESDIDCQRTASGLELCAPPAQNFTYEEIIIHPDYDTRGPYSDDIALIRLSSSIDLSGDWVEPVCLPPQGLNVRRVVGDREAVVAGWGTTESGHGSSRLLHVLLPQENADYCNKTYGGKMVQGQICFGGHVGQDSCAGDSGGPLIMGAPGDQPPFLQIGLVSYGPSTCGLDSIPGVYTSISEYRDWIDETVKP